MTGDPKTYVQWVITSHEVIEHAMIRIKKA
jgi:hypothetical protein